MCTRYIRRSSVRAKTEAELLIELLKSWTVILHGSPNSFVRVRGLDCRCGVWLDKADLHFRCEGHGVLLSTGGAFHVSIDCNDAAWSRHLEFEIGIVWHRIEASKRGSYEQCMIATAEQDDIEGQVFASKVVWQTEEDFQRD